MAVPNYTYLKLKMSGPRGVITIGTSFQRTYECEVECCELVVIKEGIAKEAPDSKWSVGSFEPIEGTKEVLIDPSSTKGKVVHIGTSLSPKWESALVDFLRTNRDIFAWKPSDMPCIPREVTEHALKIRLGSKPVKQHLHHFDEEKHKAIGENIAKLLTVGFIQEVNQP
jgi:hypothetical protein